MNEIPKGQWKYLFVEKFNTVNFSYLFTERKYLKNKTYE